MPRAKSVIRFGYVDIFCVSIWNTGHEKLFLLQFWQLIAKETRLEKTVRLICHFGVKKEQNSNIIQDIIMARHLEAPYAQSYKEQTWEQGNCLKKSKNCENGKHE